MECFEEAVNGQKPLTIFAKRFILDVRQGKDKWVKCLSVFHQSKMVKFYPYSLDFHRGNNM